MRNHSKAISEGVIPLLGYFLWDWGPHFIFLFCFLDWIAKELLIHFQTRKIVQTIGGNPNKIRQQSFLSGVLLLASILLIEALFAIRNTNFSFTQEFWEFLSYEDLGLPQGYLLLPLIVFSVWMEYTMIFKKQKLYLKIDPNRLWFEHNKANVSILSLAAIGVGISGLIRIPDLLFVLVVALGPVIWLEFNRRFLIK